jgi:hypothetical protein
MQSDTCEVVLVFHDGLDVSAGKEAPPTNTRLSLYIAALLHFSCFVVTTDRMACCSGVYDACSHTYALPSSPLPPPIAKPHRFSFVPLHSSWLLLCIMDSLSNFCSLCVFVRVPTPVFCVAHLSYMYVCI